MTASAIPVPFNDDNKYDMLEHGLVELDASAYEADTGVTWSGVLKRLDVNDLLDIRNGLLSHWGEPAGDDDESKESTASAVRFLFQTIQNEIGGRWVGWRG